MPCTRDPRRLSFDPSPFSPHDVTRAKKQFECGLIVHHEAVGDTNVVEDTVVELDDLVEDDDLSDL